MTFLAWSTYLFVVIGLLLIPGNMTILAINHGIRFGVRKSIGTALGSSIGALCVMSISMAGLAAIVNSSELAYNCIKWGGAVYLIYLGIESLRSSGLDFSSASKAEKSNLDRPAYKLFLQSFFTALSNPKGIIFFASFFPQFINLDAPKLPQFSILAGTFMFCDFIIMMSLACASQLIVPFLNNEKRGKLFNVITGSMFIGCGSMVAVYSR